MEKHKWVSKARDKTLFAVGGAWRSLARVCIAQMAYPLHVLDNFTLDRAQAISLFDVISRLSPKSLEQIKGISRIRLGTLPLAAAVLRPPSRRHSARFFLAPLRAQRILPLSVVLRTAS